jgi:protein-tyrosine phosphatase
MKEKMHTLYEEVEGRDRDISDPFGGSLTVYKETLHELEAVIQSFLKKYSQE